MGEAVDGSGGGAVGLKGLLLLTKFSRPGGQCIQAGLPHGRLREDERTVLVSPLV